MDPETKNEKEVAVDLSEPGVKVGPKKLKTPEELISPEGQAFVNASISAAIKSALAGMAPLMESIALTPEKLAQAEALRRAPDPEKVARDLRERKAWARSEAQRVAQVEASQSKCRHKYATGQFATSLISNYPDRQQRVVCHLCMKMFHPRQWTIDAPQTPDERANGEGHARVEPETPGYSDILAATVDQKGVNAA